MSSSPLPAFVRPTTLGIRVGLSIALALGVFLCLSVVPADAAAQLVLPDDSKSSDDGRKDTRKKRSDDSDEKGEACNHGKTKSADTQGHCCWPGQVWNGKACVGVPSSCPDSLKADAGKQACVVPPCETSMVLVDDTHCCWPEQGWSVSRNACVGIPKCPEGWVADGESCTRDAAADATADADGDGIADGEDQCPDAPEDANSYQDEDGCPDAEALALRESSDGASAEGDDTSDSGDGSATSEPPPPVDEPPAIGGVGIAGWVVFGVGVALAGTGAGLQLAAESKRDEVRDAGTSTLSDGREVTSGVTQREAADIQDEADLLSTIGWVGVGVGGAAVITGLVLVLVDDPAPDTQVGATPLKDGAALVFRQRF